MEKIWYSLFEEFLVRQIFWMFNDTQNKNEIIKLSIKCDIKKEKEYIEEMKKI